MEGKGAQLGWAEGGGCSKDNVPQAGRVHFVHECHLLSDRDHGPSYGKHAFTFLFKKYSLGATTWSRRWD